MSGEAPPERRKHSKTVLGKPEEQRERLMLTNPETMGKVVEWKAIKIKSVKKKTAQPKIGTTTEELRSLS